MNGGRTNNSFTEAAILAGSQRVSRIHTGRDEGKIAYEEGKAYAKSQKCDNSALGQKNPLVARAGADGTGEWAAEGHVVGEELVEVFACPALEIGLLWITMTHCQAVKGC